MLRARRILGLLPQENNRQPVVRPSTKRILDYVPDECLNNNRQKCDGNCASPIPQAFENDLIQLQDLLGDVFNDHEPKRTEGVTEGTFSPDITDSECSDIKKCRLTSGSSKKTTCLVPETSTSSNNDERFEHLTELSTEINLESVHNTPDNSNHHNPMPSPQRIHEFCDNEFCSSCEVLQNTEQQSYSNIETPSTISALNSVPTPSSTASRKLTFEQDKGKKRLVHKENWLLVQRKLLKNKGKSYTTRKGKSVPNKIMQAACDCRMKCGLNLSQVYAEQFDRIEYKYDLNKQSKTIIVLRSGTRNTQRISRDFELKQAYGGPLPISQDKYRDRIQLCQTGIIPERYHAFYKSLAHFSINQSVNINDDDDENSE